jgi:hypothetical protein
MDPALVAIVLIKFSFILKVSNRGFAAALYPAIGPVLEAEAGVYCCL